MSIDVVTPDTRRRPTSKRIQWWCYTALAGLAVAITTSVVAEAFKAGVGRPFWAVMIALAVAWSFFGATFWLARNKPRRRK
jgi:hypothetical protein